jgi:hypothetical protein
MDEFSIRLREADTIPSIAGSFAALGWSKPATQYARYLQEQQLGEREVLVAWQGEVFAGYVTVVWRSNYPPFLDADVPEIADFNVLPHLRRRRIWSHGQQVKWGETVLVDDHTLLYFTKRLQG